MNPFTSPTIDEIKKEYEYKIDPLDFLYTADVIYCILHGNFIGRFEGYKFDEKIKEIRKIIHNKSDTIDKIILESFEKTLKNISDFSEEVKKKIDFDREEIIPTIRGISSDYERNKDKPGAIDIYLKISKEIIDKEIKILIQYEKKFILYNEQIISIKKKLFN